MKVNFRRFLYQQQRKLIVGFLAFFLILNIIPFAWPRINSAFNIENSIINNYSKKWGSRYLDVIRTDNRDMTKIPSRLERFLQELPVTQIRETHGRLKVEAIVKLLELHIKNDKKKRSLELAKELVEYSPYDYRAHYLLGQAYLINSKSKMALTSFQDSLKLNPNIFEIVKAEIKLLIEKGGTQEAVDAFLKYQNAHFVRKAPLRFRDVGQDFDRKFSFEIPLVINGEKRTYKVFPENSRLNKPKNYQLINSIEALGFEFPDVKGAVVKFDSIRVNGKRVVGEERKILFRDDNFSKWKRTEVAEIGENQFIALPGKFFISKPLEKIKTSEVSNIELTLSIQKPVDRETLGLLRKINRTLANKDLQKMLDNSIPFDQSEKLDIAVIGHVRKNLTDEIQVQQSLLDNLRKIDAGNDALIFTGDIVWRGTEENWDQVEKLVDGKLSIPVYIAPGNHDLNEANDKSKEVFSEFYNEPETVQIKDSLLVFINTERKDPENKENDFEGELSRDQIKLLLSAITEAKNNSSINHLLIFQHRVLWFYGTERYLDIYSKANKSSRINVLEKSKSKTNFWESVFPNLLELAKTKSVVLFAGDIGSNFPILYDDINGVKLIASGNDAVSEADWNHYLQVSSSGKNLDIKILPLNNFKFNKIEDYNLEYWRGNK